MKFSQNSSTFSGFTQEQAIRLADNYTAAVQMGDVDWLEHAVATNPLSLDNRRWLANLDLPDKQNMFVIHAVATDNHRLLGFLLREGAGPDAALPHAQMKRDSKAVKMLCDANADANMVYQGVPLLNLSAVLWDAESCRHLLEAKAEVNAYRSQDQTCTALYDCLGAYQQKVTTGEHDHAPQELLQQQDCKDALRTMGVLLEYNANPHQKSGPDILSAYELAESFSAFDQRPLTHIQAWQQEASAAAQASKLLARLKLGGLKPQ